MLTTSTRSPSSSPPQNPKIGDNILLWNHRFTWTSHHRNPQQLRSLLFSYDELATQALDRLDELSPPDAQASKSCPHGGSGKGQRDVLALVEKYAEQDDVLGRLWGEINTVPEWVDWEQIARGQRVVYRFNGQVMMGLLYISLLGGMGAARVVETLSRTGGFGVNVSKRRLLETLQHFMEVVESLPSIQPGGKGHASSARVRLLHASVRRRLLRLEREKPGYFPVDKFGVPINDLHSIATISVYSAAIAYLALPRQGVRLTRDQAEDYFALWRYVGYLLGTPVDWMTSPESTKAIMESLVVSEIDPSANSKILANNILTALADAPHVYSPREYLVAQAYCLNGEELSTALGIHRPGLYYRILVWYQCFLLMALSYTYPLIPTFMQNRRDERFRRIFNALVMKEELGGLGQPSTFDFKYIPDLDKTTQLGEILKKSKDATTATLWSTTSAMVGGDFQKIALAAAGMMLGSVFVLGMLHTSGVVHVVPPGSLTSMLALPEMLSSS